MSNGYIYCVIPTGLNDLLTQLNICTEYAIKYNRSIILKTSCYKCSKLNDIIDYSSFPVPLFTESKLKEITYTQKIPPYPEEDKNIHEFVNIKFDKSKNYSKDILLIHASAGAGLVSIDILKKIKFTPSFLNIFYEQFKLLPPIYDAIHFRETDRANNYNNINAFKISINQFIESSKNNVYIASDSKLFLEDINLKYPNKIIKSKSLDSITKTKYFNFHNIFGDKDENMLINAFIDLLILGKANNLKISEGGYTLLAQSLWFEKNLVYNLLNPDALQKEVSNKNHILEIKIKNNNNLLLFISRTPRSTSNFSTPNKIQNHNIEAQSSNLIITKNYILPTKNKTKLLLYNKYFK